MGIIRAFTSLFEQLSFLSLEQWSALIGIVAVLVTTVAWAWKKFSPRRSSVAKLKLAPSIRKGEDQQGKFRTVSLKIDILNDDDFEVEVVEMGLRNRRGSESMVLPRGEGLPFRMSGRKTHWICSNPHGLGPDPDFSKWSHVYVRTACCHVIKHKFKDEIREFGRLHKEMSDMDRAEHKQRIESLRPR